MVVEAKARSGTGITANYVRKFKRQLFCIPHTIEDKAGIGTNRLIKKGAMLVTSVEDILKYYKKEVIPQIQEMKVEIPEEYRQVYEIISEESISSDEISRKIKVNIREVNTILTMLELEGFIESLPGNCYKRKIV